MAVRILSSRAKRGDLTRRIIFDASQRLHRIAALPSVARMTIVTTSYLSICKSGKDGEESLMAIVRSSLT
jgi:hypothetical protein